MPPTRDVKYRIIYPSFGLVGTGAEADHDGLFITHVGRIAPGKGQMDAVKACIALADAGIEFRLNLLGNVDNQYTRDQLQQVIEEHSLTNKVMMPGHVTNVSEWLAASDIFLFPSYGEGMANAFIEALHFGLPCLCYSNTVFPEFIEMGFKLTLAKDRDIDDLSMKLLHIAQNIDKEKELAGNNINLARNYFNVERERDSWAEIMV